MPLQKEILKGMDHLFKINEWIIDPRVLEAIKGTGFEQFLSIQKTRHNLRLITALMHTYNRQTGAFNFGGQEFYFGLEDVLYITGLPIDGKVVSGVDDIPTDLCNKYLGKVSEEVLGGDGSVTLEWLRRNFEHPPLELMNSSELFPYARALILYIIGSVIVPDKTSIKVPVMYLSLLEDISKIKEYAWGAALLVHLHKAMASWQEKPSTSIMGHIFALEIFAYERIPKLVMMIENMKENAVSPVPRSVPLVVYWSEYLRESSKGTVNVMTAQSILDLLHATTEEEIVWQPYHNLDLPVYTTGQVWMTLSSTILICFEKAIYHRPYSSLKQYGLREVDDQFVCNIGELQTRSRAGPKGKDWRDECKECISEWDKRTMYVISSQHSPAPPDQHSPATPTYSSLPAYQHSPAFPTSSSLPAYYASLPGSSRGQLFQGLSNTQLLESFISRGCGEEVDDAMDVVDGIQTGNGGDEAWDVSALVEETQTNEGTPTANEEEGTSTANEEEGTSTADEEVGKAMDGTQAEHDGERRLRSTIREPDRFGWSASPKITKRKKKTQN